MTGWFRATFHSTASLAAVSGVYLLIAACGGGGGDQLEELLNTANNVDNSSDDVALAPENRAPTRMALT